MTRRFPKNKIETTTLKMSIFTGLELEVIARGARFKKERRTILLHLFKSIKRELKFIKGMSLNNTAVLYHSDSYGLQWLYERYTPASIYQSTQVISEAERFGHCPRVSRNQLGLTQKKLAKHIKIDRTYLAKIERGWFRISEEKKQYIANHLYDLFNNNSTEAILKINPPIN